MNKITIDGVTTYVSGNNIRVHNGTIYVDGVLVKEGLKGEVTVKFEGDLANLDCESAVIHGNVGGNVDSTSLKVNGDIKGNVDATSVKCNNIGGSVKSVSVSYKK